MRPIASDQSRTQPALNEVFGNRGHVRLLRVLTTDTDGSVASPEVADRVGMTPSGARKALRRLARAGVVEKVGNGKATRYLLCREGRLASEIARLFELEREDGESESKDDRTEGEGSGEARRAEGNGKNGNGGRPSGREKAGNGASNRNGNGSPSVLDDVEPSSPEFHSALVSLLEEDLSLIRRAREKVLEKLEERQAGNGHDLWEWRKILDTYSLPKLLHFLESRSPRAARLRKSSPFPEVMSDEERERLGGYVDRVH
jgi:hypothetical protein